MSSRERWAAKMASLFVSEGQEGPVLHELAGMKVTVGRGPGCDIVLRNPLASRRHALIVCKGGRHAVVDLGSKNGIWLNGVRVQRRILKHRDVLWIGAARIDYLSADDSTTLSGLPSRATIG